MGLSDADVGLSTQQVAPQQQMLPGANQPLPPQATPNIGKQTGQVGLSDDEVGLGQQQPAQNSWSGSAKAVGQGLVDAAAGVAGLPGDITSLVTGGKHGSGFGSEAIQKGIESYTGHHDPETTLQKYLQTGASFLPAAALPAGELGIGTRLLRMVAAPAIASETAGQLTQGTAAEPYARAGAAILGGGLGAGIRSRAAAPALLGADDLERISNAAYQSPQLQNAVFRRSAVQGLRSDMQQSLGNLADPQLGLQTARLIDGMAGPGMNNLRFGTIQNTRTLLGQLGGSFGNPLEQAAAGRAREALDTWIGNLQQSDMLAGDAQNLRTTLGEAQRNLFAARTLDVLNGREYAADLSAAAANSGANYENALRQRIKGILISPAQRSRFEQIPGAIDAMETIVRGGRTDNLLRIFGNMMGGGGGMLGAMHGMAGFFAGAGPAGFAIPAAGAGLKMAGNRIIGNRVNNLRDMVAAGAPANAQAVAQRGAIAAQPNPGLDYRRALLNAALAGRNQQPLLPQQ